MSDWTRRGEKDLNLTQEFSHWQRVWFEDGFTRMNISNTWETQKDGNSHEQRFHTAVDELCGASVPCMGSVEELYINAVKTSKLADHSKFAHLVARMPQLKKVWVRNSYKDPALFDELVTQGLAQCNCVESLRFESYTPNGPDALLSVAAWIRDPSCSLKRFETEIISKCNYQCNNYEGRLRHAYNEVRRAISYNRNNIAFVCT